MFYMRPSTGNLLSIFLCILLLASLASFSSAKPLDALGSGDLYVISTYENEVNRFNGSTGQLEQKFISAGDGGLGTPYASTFGLDRNLYVASYGTQEVKRYNGTTGDFIDNFVSGGSGAYGSNFPQDLAFGPDGNLYVNSDQEVKRFNGTTGAFIDTFVPASEGKRGGGTYVSLSHLAFGPDRNLYVTDFGSDTVKRFNGTTGHFIDAFVAPGAGGLSVPSNLSFGPDGNLYVSSGGTGEVKRFNGTTGAFMGDFVNEGSGGLYSLRGMAFGPDGSLYVGSFLTSNVKRYDGKTGEFLGNFVTKSSSGGATFTPYDITFGPDGNMYVSDFSLDRVKRFNGTSGAFIDDFVGGRAGGLSFPVDLVFGPDGNLYVGSQFTAEVKRYNGTTGTFLDTFVKANAGGLSRPTAITFGHDGNLYVIDEDTRDVKRYNGTTGAFIDRFIPAGAGGLSFPEGIVFGPDGNAYVSSLGITGSGLPDEIKRYNGTTGAFMDNFAANTGGLKGPTGLVFGPDGNLYVASLSTNEVKRYNGITGAFMDNFVTEQSGGLSGPLKMAFGPSGDLFVGNGSVIKRYNGTTGAFISNFVQQRSSALLGGFVFGSGPAATYTKTINTVDLAGNPLDGVRVSIRALDGSEVKSGFTPMIFTAEAESKFNVVVSDFIGKQFSHWADGSKDRAHTVEFSTSNPVVAYFDTDSAIRGFSPLSYSVTNKEASLTVKAVAGDNATILHMWTIIQPVNTSSSSSNSTTTMNKTYKVHVSDFQDNVFDHWQDNGSTNRTRVVTISEPTTLTATFSGVNGKIAFVSTRDGNLEIYTMNGDGSEQTNVSHNPANDDKPVWSLDGSKLAFISDRDNRTELYVMDRDGNNLHRITNLNSTILNPAWSPNGTEIAFSISSKDNFAGDSEIYVAHTDGTGMAKRLTNNNVDDLFPAWSDDGSHIHFARSIDSQGRNWTLFNMDADNGGEQQRLSALTIDKLDDLYWSPDGSKVAIAYTQYPSLLYLPPSTSISVASLNDSEPRVLASGTHQGGLCWSSDGTKIVFGVGRFRGPSSDVNIMNADGSNLRRLTGTSDSGNDGDPCFSPDGTKIVFGGNRFGNGEVYVMNIDGTGEKRLTQDLSHSNFSPSWGRQPGS